MNSRERVEAALGHREPDRVPLDLGGSAVTGMHASTVYALRQSLELDPPYTPVKVVEPFQMLGEITPDLQDTLGVDVVGLGLRANMFGFENSGWKPWTLFDGTPVLVPGRFNTNEEPDGSVVQYPRGYKSNGPCVRMPKDGFYFDAIDRQGPIDWANLDPEDNLEEFGLIPDDELRYLEKEAKRLYETGKAIFANFGGTSFGDIALVPGMQLREPKGIRGVKEWYMCSIRRPDYMLRVYERQLEIALENLKRIYGAVGDRVSVAFITGTDFGGQKRPLMSNASYSKLYKPFHRRVNDWIHENTEWKTFIHSCGSVEPLINEFIEAGFDVLNPVQTTAADMDPLALKNKYGDKISFWGGGVDTQGTLPFGTPEEVREQVAERIRVLSPGGGFVLNTVHNVQPRIPVENVRAMYETVRDYGSYSNE
jgi:hypothetical protein